MTTPGTPQIQAKKDIPLDEIRDAAKNYPECIVRVRRRNIRGNWATVGASVRKPTEELAEIEDWLRDIAGGGYFRVEAVTIDDRTRHIVPPFEIEIEGAERASKIAMTGQGMSPAGGNRMGEPAPPQRYWGPSGPQVIVDDAGATIAQETARDYRADFIAERNAREQERTQSMERLDMLQKQISHIEAQRVADVQAAERRALESKLSSLEQRMSTPQKPTLDPQAIVAVVTGLSGILTAVIESGRARSQLQADSLERSVTNQLGLVKDLVKRQPEDSGGIAKLLEAVSPLLKTMMEERSPGKIAELVGAQSDATMQTLSIVSQFIDKMAPDQGDNPWVDMARQAVGSLTRAAEQMGQYTRGAMGAGSQGAQGGPGRLPAQASPGQIADAVMSAPGLPVALKTREWHQIFFGLHVGVDPKEISQQMARLLEKIDPLPPPFTGMFEDEVNLPSAYLGRFMQQLPVWQLNQRYARAVLAAFDEAFQDETEDEVDVSPQDTRNGNGFAEPAPFVVVDGAAVDEESSAEPSQNS